MSPLNEIKLFLHFAQIVGGFPYCVTTDPAEKRLSFSLRWRSLPLIWFAIVTSLQCASPLIALQMFTGYVSSKITTSNLVFRVCSLGTLFFLMIGSRWVVLQPNRWRRVLQYARDVERFLAKEDVFANGTRVRTHCCIGVALAIALVNRSRNYRHDNFVKILCGKGFMRYSCYYSYVQ